jgi:N utilization substance protein A
VGPKTIEKIEAHGVTSIEKLADMTPEELTAIPGIGEKMVEKIQLSVAAHFQSIEQQQAAEAVQPADIEEQPGEAEPVAEDSADPIAADANVEAASPEAQPDNLEASQGEAGVSAPAEPGNSKSANEEEKPTEE